MRRVRATFHLEPRTLDALRDAAAHLAGAPYFKTAGEIVNDALEGHLAVLRQTLNAGAPFPRRARPLRGGPRRRTT